MFKTLLKTNSLTSNSHSSSIPSLVTTIMMIINDLLNWIKIMMVIGNNSQYSYLLKQQNDHIVICIQNLDRTIRKNYGVIHPLSIQLNSTAPFRTNKYINAQRDQLFVLTTLCCIDISSIKSYSQTQPIQGDFHLVARIEETIKYTNAFIYYLLRITNSLHLTIEKIVYSSILL